MANSLPNLTGCRSNISDTNGTSWNVHEVSTWGLSLGGGAGGKATLGSCREGGPPLAGWAAGTWAGFAVARERAGREGRVPRCCCAWDALPLPPQTAVIWQQHRSGLLQFQPGSRTVVK
jgi:hypothetical protein